MIKKKQILLIILILLLTFICNDNAKVYANTILSGGGPIGGGGSGYGGGGSGGGTCGGPANCPANITACCLITQDAEIYADVNLYAYDMYGNMIVKDLDIYQDTLAGTYIGLNVYEKKWYNSWANYSVSAIQTYYKCTHTYYVFVCYRYDPRGKCLVGADEPRSNTYEAIYGCNAGDSGTAATRPAAPCGSAVAACAARAIPPVIQLTPSYKAVYHDSNDIETTESSDEYNTAEIINGGVCNSNQNSTSNNKGTYSGTNTYSQTCNFYYNRQKTCINVKSGKVRYIDNNEECYPITDDKNPEYEIKSEDEYWKYFVPLNANSGNDFSFMLNSSGNKEHPRLCKDYIDKYDNYALKISGPNNEVLPKITSNMTAKEKREIKNQAKKMVENGCYYQTIITIPVKQKFYNELENGINFNGFNFYYKPIDINEPFPNGINETSLWYKWNNNNKKDPDLTKSYNEVTYIAQINNVNKIREYTKDNSYTNWYTMYVNGTSSYIENSGVITRYVDRDSYYSLGCGPINENEYTDASKKVRNVFYQKECSK